MLSKREAIRECKRKYRTLLSNELTEREKETYLEDLEIKYEWGCPLCQYELDHRGTHFGSLDSPDKCAYCPLVLQFGGQCEDLGWNSCMDDEDMQAFAETYIFKLTGDR